MLVTEDVATALATTGGAGGYGSPPAVSPQVVAAAEQTGVTDTSGKTIFIPPTMIVDPIVNPWTPPPVTDTNAGSPPPPPACSKCTSPNSPSLPSGEGLPVNSILTGPQPTAPSSGSADTSGSGTPAVAEAGLMPGSGGGWALLLLGIILAIAYHEKKGTR